MAVDKTLEIDLNNLTPDTLDAIDNQLDTVLSEFVNPESRTIRERFGDPLLTPQVQKESTLRKIFGRETFNNILSFGSNPFGFIQGTVLRLIPFIGAALAATGVIFELIKRVDDFQKEFVDNVDGRIELFRSKETQARIQAGLDQIIITTDFGSPEPRDAYNTFRQFNENQAELEADFKIRETQGVD